MSQHLHPYWGTIAADWAGFSAEKELLIPGFEKAVTIFLGEESDEAGEEIKTPPAAGQLDEYAQTFQQFLARTDPILAAIKASAFARYQELYAHYYEDEKHSGEAPLGIGTAEQHFAYMRDLSYIRALDGGVIKLPIYYTLDPEHGLEVRLENGLVAAVGGLAET